jgi:hypothetical protein
MSSPKRLARIAGLLYLIVGIFGSFAIAYVTAKVYTPGDAATTAGNVLANAGLVRMGVIADLLQATFFIFLLASTPGRPDTGVSGGLFCALRSAYTERRQRLYTLPPTFMPASSVVSIDDAFDDTLWRPMPM